MRFQDCVWTNDPIAGGACVASDDGEVGAADEGGESQVGEDGEDLRREETPADVGGASSSGDASAAPAEAARAPPLVAAPISGRHRHGHAEFQVLNRLAAAMGNGPWSGSIFLYVDMTPCLSCIGALAQFRRQWPDVSVNVAYEHGPSEPHAADALLPVAAADDTAAQLEAAVVRMLKTKAGLGTLALPIALVGTNPRVRELWGELSATGARPSGKNQPGKKREWQDKLKYFLSHRPGTFLVEEAGVAAVRLAVPDSGPRRRNGGEDAGHAPASEFGAAAATRALQFEELQDAVDEAIVRLLKRGRASRDRAAGEGFVPIEEVGCDERVSRLWRDCQHDKSDRLAYFLKHSEHFEVWAPDRAGIKDESGRGDLRSWVRIRL